MATPEIDGSKCCADQLLLRAGSAASDLAHCLDGQVFDDCAGLIKLGLDGAARRLCRKRGFRDDFRRSGIPLHLQRAPLLLTRMKMAGRRPQEAALKDRSPRWPPTSIGRLGTVRPWHSK
jgi:hypothetical protein